MVKTLPSNAGGAGSVPDWRTKIPHAVQCGQKNFKKKRNEVLVHVTTWINLENMMLSARSQTQKVTYCDSFI